MNDLLESFTLPFMQNALLAGLMIGALCGYFGTFIVQRGLSFLGDGLAHAAFGGVALALLLGWTPLWVALPFTVLMSLGITFLREKTALGGDTAIGVIYATSVALGILFLGLRKDYTVDAFTYLFGSILAVRTTDLWAVGALLLLCAALIPFTWGRLAYATFDAELARADRIPVRGLDYLLSSLIALTVVVSVKVVGILPVNAFLILPAATARLLSPTLFRMTVLSAAMGIVSSVLGLCLSFLLDVPSGSTLILSQVAMFALAALLSRRARA